MRFHPAAAGLAALLSLTSVGHAQAPTGPPSVGVVRAQQTAITETSEFIGRVQAIDRVALTARVTAFLDQRLFTEGTEVQQGDLLYRLERAPVRGRRAAAGSRRRRRQLAAGQRQHPACPGAIAAEHAGGPALQRR